MKKKDIKGIYVLSNKTFYTYEAGNTFTANNLNRIKSTLISRGLIDYSRDDAHYELLNQEQAEAKGATIEIIYISKLTKESQAFKPIKTGWK